MNFTTESQFGEQMQFFITAQLSRHAKQQQKSLVPSSAGVQAYSAFDESNVYVAVTNQGMNYINSPGKGHVEPAFESMQNSIENGSITALDLKTRKVMWEHKTYFPT